MKVIRRLMNRFRNVEYRRAYVDEFTDSYIATQLKVLREQRGFTQEQLAERLGVKQSQICRWESVNNRSWQVRTLKRIAGALDLALVVRFESFGKILPEIGSFGRAALERPAFADDPVFRRILAKTIVDDSDTGAQTGSSLTGPFVPHREERIDAETEIGSNHANAA
jgi:transcriptional regulator with XRE-family HTH domain